MGTLRNFLSYILKHVVRVLIRKIEDRTTIDAKLNRCIIKMRESLEKYGAPDRIRTCDLWNRNPTLYPAELRVQRSRLNRVQRLVHTLAWCRHQCLKIEDLRKLIGFPVRPVGDVVLGHLACGPPGAKMGHLTYCLFDGASHSPISSILWGKFAGSAFSCRRVIAITEMPLRADPEAFFALVN